MKQQMWTILLNMYKYKTYYCANAAISTLGNVCACVCVCENLLNNDVESNTIVYNLQ